MAVGGKLARALRLLPLAVVGIALVPWPAPAQTSDAWPSRPLRFILPFPPGGGTDILGRLIAERLTASLGQPVVTENRGGAGGNVGAEAAARSAPDGYTIVLVAPSLAISTSLYSKLSYDPVKDFAPISLVATVPNVMVTHPSVPAGTLAEFIRLVKTKPGEMNFGSGGSGTSNHLAGELFNIVAGVKLVHVPYKGVNLAMNDVLSGQIHLVVIGVPAAAPHIKAGKLRALALVAPQRAAALPEVPTAAEAGLPNFEVTTWYGILAPAGTPRTIVTRLNAELVKAMHAPDLKERLAAMATDPATSTPEEFADYIKREIAKWGEVVRQAGLLLEGFDALGDHGQIEALAHGDDRLGDRLVLEVLRKVADKGAVHLERVDREALEVRERRVADSEVVDGEPHAHLLDFGEHPARALGVLDHHALGELELEQFRPQPGALQRGRDILDQILVGELARREVHRHVQRRKTFPLPGDVLRASGVQHPFPDRHDEPGL